ncbi:MgtC/SapB family protein [Oceanirhabdus sp. W0125-5]|uniref:MgtC/SapB family protein n=1 Tax=Oceanirhabdus sp. W0125-5 TaxID=2999116 RepID=UPI0022F2C5FD|nr:MgtC/SapB family protein [Oceanirhabdus sp. W0125-5]WBW99212.1 MgtC/SapB family protein [Oceanirhabdus sp. W0125-5]
MILRLSLAVILGGCIGFEREVRNRPAGLRTHVLVTLGATLIMLISMYGFNGGDPARLAAQVVSGIGFLGAGTILRDNSGVKGLTTAASIWVCGGIGLALGNGYYGGALVTTFFVLISLILLGLFERRILVSKFHKFELECEERIGLIGDIGSIFAKNKMSIIDIKIDSIEEEEEIRKLNISMQIKMEDKARVEVLMEKLLNIDGVTGVIYNKKRLNNK